MLNQQSYLFSFEFQLKKIVVKKHDNTWLI